MHKPGRPARAVTTRDHSETHSPLENAVLVFFPGWQHNQDRKDAASAAVCPEHKKATNYLYRTTNPLGS